MEKKYNFNAEKARANVKTYEAQVQKAYEEKAQKAVNGFLATIDRDSRNGVKSVPLQSSHTDIINNIIKKDLEELGFKVKRQGQIFRISWS